MATSCSFRITRTAEDLAQTLTAISQRLVKLEQRIETLELTSSKSQVEQSDEEMTMLDGVDQLLEECKGLLNTEKEDDQTDELWINEDMDEQNMAA
tara:strand:- start:2 stop:289 length:288 start_codon:yes stop_codon:yes gene_type:complete